VLLIDENLSYRLVARLFADFPGTVSVAKEIALGEGAPDSKVWKYAKMNDLAILTKDKDFVDYWKQHGPPPKIIRLEIGNSRLNNIESLMKHNKIKVLEFINSRDGLLLLKDL